MAASSDNLLRYIRRLAVHAESNESSDTALLGRFLANRDERAFAALVERHAALVLQVCWRILGNIHDAQDAFQATFLVLARKAATVRPPEALPAWLHGVARRVALKTRSARFRKQRLERPLAEMTMDPRPDPLSELSVRDYLAIIDEEVRRLPEVYRLPVILCCLEGRSIEEAAQQLGWTTGSVKGRLERGRARLHARLARRGLTLSAALAATELSRGAVSAALAAGLTGPLVSAAMTFAARQMPPAAAVSAQAAAIAGDFLKSMALAKLKTAAALMLAMCLLAGGLLAYRQADVPRMAGLEVPTPSTSSANPPKPAAPAALSNKEKSKVGEETYDRMEVSGRVLDPQGRPLAGARLYVGYAYRRSELDAVAHPPIYPLRATSGMDGRFHFVLVRSDLDARYLDASRPVVIAAADGFGLDWAEIGGAAAVTVSLRLVQDFPLEGRVLDAQRNPVAGAKVFVREVSSDSAANRTRFIENQDRSSPTLKTCWGPLPEQPPQVTTGYDGRFRLTGLGRDRRVMLALAGPAIPPTERMAITRPAAAIPAGSMLPCGVPFEFVAVAPRSIRGVVRDKTTGQAVAGVKISEQVDTCEQRNGSSTHTDKDGRYELLVYPGSSEYVILAQPQNGQPYFAAAAHLPKTPGLAPLTADFELIGGIPLQGRVIDQATGNPPKRAVVEYYPLFPNAHSSVLTRLAHFQAASSATLQADGSFSLTVLPGPGVVLVAASPRDSYACARIDEQELANLFKGRDLERRREALRRLLDQGLANLSIDGADRGGSSWLFIGSPWVKRCVDRYNALCLIQLDEGTKSLVLDVTVQPARPLRGTVIRPNGLPLCGVEVCGLTSMPDAEMLETTSFLVEGLNPQRTRELSFHHKEKGLGKFLTIRGEETKTLTVQLEPCSEVIGRVMNRAGRPVPGVRIGFHSEGKGLAAKAETDRQGRFRAALVPGLQYYWGLPTQRQRTIQVLTVESGKIKDLGDLLLDDPINHNRAAADGEGGAPCRE
jgi:RNA polymerase sigma factor (sigma-70 family)